MNQNIYKERQMLKQQNAANRLLRNSL
jgi:hypothetical protein